jgi:hypothetical protein
MKELEKKIMKVFHMLYGKKPVPLLIFLLLIFSLLSLLNVNVKVVSAVDFPSIIMEPALSNTTLTLGTTFTISIKTDYNGTDIFSWGFALTYNPNVLQIGANKTDTWTSDGENKTFYTTKKPIIQDSEEVYVNQTLMTKPANYTIDDDIGKINLKLTATDTWTGDSATTQFNTTQTPVVKGSEKVYVNQILMIRNENYTINNSTGEITFNTPPSLGVKIKAIYQYPPSLGVEIKAIYLYGVVNGDLITKDKNSTAELIAGTYDNIEGKLGRTSAGFFGDTDPTDGVDVTSGPGTLANVTFTVVGYGATNITFGRGSSETFLQCFNATPSPGNPYGQAYFIIEAATMPDHIQDSYLINIQNLHTVGVPCITASSEVVVEHVADINVTVVNGGNFTENGNVTLYYNMTEIGTKPFTMLGSGEFETVSFSWNTSGVAQGNYTLNATVTISVDEYSNDNTKTALVELKEVHDVAILNLSAPTQPDIGEPITVNVTIANNGSFEESVNITLIFGQWHETSKRLMNPTLIGSKMKNVSAVDSALVQFNWDASGIDPQPTHTLNATVTISETDIHPDDNIETTTIKVVKGHDVTVQSVEVTSPVFVGQSASINVTVQNNGLYTEESVNVTLSYRSALVNTTIIDSQVKNISKWESILIQFSWNTSGVALDNYVLSATATISGDGNPLDNTRSATIIVKGARITGVITNALTGDPINAASIIAGDYSAVTDINGTYNITNVLPGAYDVTVSATGYENASKLDIIVIAESEPTTLNFALRVISNITISADPTTVSVGQNTNISGSLSPALDGVTITIQYRLGDAETWTSLTTTTTENGNYSCIWMPQTAGTYEMKASWLGDEKTVSAENSVQVTVEEVSSDIFLYLAIGAAVAGVSGLAIAVYLLKIRKPT